MAGERNDVAIDLLAMQSQESGFEFKDFHSSDPSMTGDIGEGGEIGRGPQDTDKLLEEEEGGRPHSAQHTFSWSSFFSFEYYQSFFDVTTAEVLHRVLAGTVPYKTSLMDVLHPNPDLYGPFWLCATLIFCIALSGNISRIFSEGSDWEFHFHDVTVLGTVLYSYIWLVPAILWAGLWWRHHSDGYSLLKLLAVYGYSMAVFIPVVVVWVVDSEIVRWVSLCVGILLSGSVLVRALWKPLRNESTQVAVVVLVILFLLHVGLAIGFKYYYFSSGLAPSHSNDTTH